ncbi:MAG: hypothetical protein WC979_06275 [Candidatus Pacearchaeota archaeon]|jgi:hypothetical protein
MNEDSQSSEPLFEVGRRILEEIRKNGDSPEIIRNGIERFARGYERSVNLEERERYDSETLRFIIEIVGANNLAGIELYKNFYESRKKQFEQTPQARPMPAVIDTYLAPRKQKS